ncbi:MAG: SDR family NAD(P)-dependent oxidoreductase [Acidobacteria bacterium]|jgi:2-hydroxycyclohexanecarboxyl-CoA dehydrogenase|nr:SDR family NAD(P)-dependent oxidoreductase [Acidobacteriota bacterium]
MDLELRDHVAVVTGGASGIGLACVEALEREGCRVAVWDRQGPRSVDVSVLESVQEALRETEARLGPVRHLVHAAAMGSGKFGFPFLNLAPGDWPRVLEVNILGMVNVAQALAPGMMERRAGTMVFLASVAGQIGSQTDPPYSASKAANINFAQCLAKDLAPYEVRVNTVNPGMVRTPLNRAVWQAWHEQQPAEKRRTYEEWAGEKVRAVAPLGRWQEPAEIADMVVFLSSARARSVTGQTINVDGGQVMHW